jgi:hypothetical protein
LIFNQHLCIIAAFSGTYFDNHNVLHLVDSMGFEPTRRELPYLTPVRLAALRN